MNISNIYGNSAYGQLLDYSVFAFDPLDYKIPVGEMIIKIYDKSGSLMYVYNSMSDKKFIASLNFKITQKGCESGSVSFLILPDALGFRIDWNDLIEIYLNDSYTPIFKGFFTKIPSTIGQNDIYTYTFYGYWNMIRSYPINIDLTNVSLDTIIKEVLANIKEYENPVIVDFGQIENSGKFFNGRFKSKNQKFEEVVKKLEDIAVDYRFGIFGDGVFKFYPISDRIVKDCVFFYDDVKKGKVSLDSTDLDNIINYYIIERKKTDQKSGSVKAGNYNGATPSNIIALDGTIKQNSSIDLYGIRMEKLTVPEMTNDNDAMLYGIGKIQLKSFPSYKGRIVDIPIDYFNESKIPIGFAKVYDKEKLYLELIDEMQTDGRMTNSEISNLKYHSGTGSTRITGNKTCEYTMQFNLDLTQTYQVNLWAYPIHRGNLSIILYNGTSAIKTFNYIFTNPNYWYLISIPLSNAERLNKTLTKIIFQTTNTNGGFTYIDQLERLHFARNGYDVELNTVEYVFEPTRSYLNIDVGTIEIPLINEIIMATSAVENLKNISRDDS